MRRVRNALKPGAPALLSAYLVVAAASVVACAAADRDGPASSGAGGGKACVEGYAVACDCVGNQLGRQVCLPDGSGFGVCVCESDTNFAATVSVGASGSAGASTSTSASTGSGSPDITCPNKFCGEDENCHTCEVDCGICKPCDLAPKCNDAVIPKADPKYLPELDTSMVELSKSQLRERLQKAFDDATPEARLVAAALAPSEPGEPEGLAQLRQAFADNPAATAKLRDALVRVGVTEVHAYRKAHPARTRPTTRDERGLPLPPARFGDADPTGGTLECGAPILNVAIARVDVPNRYSFWSNDVIYCVVQAEAATASEIHILGKTKPLGDGQGQVFSLGAGRVWGGKEGPLAPKGALLVTYDCLAETAAGDYAKLVEGVSDAALAIGALPLGEASLVLIGVGAVGTIVSSALALVTDAHLVNAQQNIPAEKQLELTNGRKWYLNAGAPGKSWFDNGWAWKFTIQAWGCAEYGTL